MANNLPGLWRNSFWGESGSPLRAFERMRQEMDDLWDNLLEGPGEQRGMQSRLNRFEPLAEIEEKDNHFLLRFEVPGMSKKDIQVEVQGNQLHVHGERKQEHEEKKGKRFASERYYGMVERWITLPQNVKPEQIEARMENGLLEIALPKAESAQGTRIQIGEQPKEGGFFSKLLGKKEEAA